jgi:flagellar hook-basal body complex protein FliE
MDGFNISNANKFLEVGGSRVGGTSTTDGTFSLPKNSGVDEADKSFAQTLTEAIGQVNELQKDSDVKAEALATGKTDDIAGVMLAAEKADIALRTMVQVRNKIIDAYQEIMRMQV